MPAVGGSVESISIDGRIFSVPEDSDFSLDLGGFVNEVLPNGNGTSRLKQNRKPWMADGGGVSIDQNNGDQEFLQNIANSGRYVPIVITFPRATYQGTGTIVDELKFTNQNSVASLSLAGEGEMVKQSA